MPIAIDVQLIRDVRMDTDHVPLEIKSWTARVSSNQRGVCLDEVLIDV